MCNDVVIKILEYQRLQYSVQQEILQQVQFKPVLEHKTVFHQFPQWLPHGVIQPF